MPHAATQMLRTTAILLTILTGFTLVERGDGGGGGTDDCGCVVVGEEYVDGARVEVDGVDKRG